MGVRDRLALIIEEAINEVLKSIPEIRSDQYTANYFGYDDHVDAALAAVCEEEGHADFEIEHGGDENTDPYCELLCERCGRRE